MFGHLTYLIFVLVWALPILALHWIVGARPLRAHLSVLALAALLPTIYLTMADGVALRAGIWTLHDNRILGLRIGNVPIEECVFFLATNLLVVQTVILLTTSPFSLARRQRGARSEECQS